MARSVMAGRVAGDVPRRRRLAPAERTRAATRGLREGAPSASPPRPAGGTTVATAPAMTEPDPARAPEGHRPVVLAAVGDLDASIPILEAAARELRSFPGGRLHLVHVVAALPGAERIMRDGSPVYPGTESVRRAAVARLERHLATARAAGVAEVVGELAFGLPWRAIVDEATRLAADLVVVGSYDASAAARLVLGSTADGVVHHAACPVLVVRPRPAR